MASNVRAIGSDDNVNKALAVLAEEIADGATKVIMVTIHGDGMGAKLRWMSYGGTTSSDWAFAGAILTRHALE